MGGLYPTWSISCNQLYIAHYSFQSNNFRSFCWIWGRVDFLLQKEPKMVSFMFETNPSVGDAAILKTGPACSKFIPFSMRAWQVLRPIVWLVVLMRGGPEALPLGGMFRAESWMKLKLISWNWCWSKRMKGSWEKSETMELCWSFWRVVRCWTRVWMPRELSTICRCEY